MNFVEAPTATISPKNPSLYFEKDTKFDKNLPLKKSVNLSGRFSQILCASHNVQVLKF